VPYYGSSIMRFKRNSSGSAARMGRYLFPSVTLLVVHVLGAAAEVAAASGISVERKDAELRIVWRWFHLGGVGYYLLMIGILVTVCFFWKFIDKDLTRRGLGTVGLGWGLSIVIIAVIAFCSYLVLQQLLNRTVIEVDRDRVTVSQGPLPRWRGTTIATSNVEQFFSEMHSFRSGGGGLTFIRGSRTWIYFQARLKERPRGIPVDQILFSGVFRHELNPEQALFVEEQIEGYLGIEDRPVGVRGEIRR
jgi:hypothetical protein